MSVSTNDFKNGMTLELDGTLFQVIEFQHVKPGKGGAFVRTKLRNVKTGAVAGADVQRRREGRPGDRGAQGHAVPVRATATTSCSWTSQTYEQIHVPADAHGRRRRSTWSRAARRRSRRTRACRSRVDLPASMVLTITQTDPGVKGDTRTGALKPATLETGVVVKVPLFVEEGEKIKVDTRTGEYIERVKA